MRVLLLLILLYLPGVLGLGASPLHFEDYFAQGSHSGTQLVSGRLELQNGLNHGTWTSPVFFVEDKAIWNQIEGSANWDDFGLNLALYGDAESPLSTQYWYFTTTGGMIRDSSVKRSGQRSFRLRPGLGYTWASFQPTTGLIGGLDCVMNPPIFNGFQVDQRPVHLVLWVHDDTKHGRIIPYLRYVTYADSEYCLIDSVDLYPNSQLPTQTKDFTRFQWEFDPVIQSRPSNADYAYLILAFEQTNIDGPQNTVWLDDILMFQDSLITIQARTANNPACSDFSQYSDERLLYANQIKAPAPVSRCIQFRVELTRSAQGVSPKLENLNMTFARAFDFTRPDYDRAPAEFTPNVHVSGSKGHVIMNDGELYFSGTGEKAKFFGMQTEKSGLLSVEAYDVTGDGIIDGADYGHLLCGYLAKYGMNMIKFYIRGGEHNDGQLEDEVLKAEMNAFHSKFIPACKEHGVYFFLRFAPNVYLDEHLPDIIHSGGHAGPVAMTDQEVLDKFKDYISLILEHDMGGWNIGNDPAFVFAEPLNEESLLFGWRQDTIDGLNPDGNVAPREISITWATRLKHNFNVWIREKYPEFNDLITAWNNPPYGLPFHVDDGTCNAQTYSDETVCNLTIIRYNEAGSQRYEVRKPDTVDFLIWKEEDFYIQVQRHIEDIGSHILLIPGKPLWNNPAATVSSEPLSIQVLHTYPASATQRFSESNWNLAITNEPIMQRWRNSFITRHIPHHQENDAFVIGEYEYLSLSQHAAETLLMPLIGSHLSMDAIINFKFITDYDDGRQAPFSPPYSAVFSALAPVSRALFIDQPVFEEQENNALSLTLSRQVSLDAPRTIIDHTKPFWLGWLDPAYILTQGVVWNTVNASYDYMPLLPDINPPYVSNSFFFDVQKRQVKTDLSLVAGILGDIDGASLSAGIMDFEITEVHGMPTMAMFITSLDGIELESSNKMLLTVAGLAENSNMKWSHYHMRAHRCLSCSPSTPFGSAPVYLGAVEAEVILHRSEQMIVTPLDSDGLKQTALAFNVAPVDGKVSFSIGSEFRSPWYLIEAVVCEHQVYDHDCDGIIDSEGAFRAIAHFLQGILHMNDLIAVLGKYCSNC